MLDNEYLNVAVSSSFISLENVTEKCSLLCVLEVKGLNNGAVQQRPPCRINR